MGEIIELHSFSTKTADESDLEEYHEINQENVLTQKYSSPVKEFDFFTQYDVKPVLKPGQKKKKKTKEKKGKEPNLMDIINTELASVAVPITEENVITTVDKEEHERNYSYLIKSPSVQSLFSRSKPLRLDSEHG